MTINVSIGTRIPAFATSMGRVLLAWAPDAVVEEIIAGGLPALTRHTVTDAEALRGVLAQVRSDGWSIVAEELEIGLLSVSAPVRDRSGEVVAALASSTSVGRSTVEAIRSDVVPLLLDAAARISADLGHRSPARREGFH